MTECYFLFAGESGDDASECGAETFRGVFASEDEARAALPPFVAGHTDHVDWAQVARWDGEAFHITSECIVDDPAHCAPRSVIVGDRAYLWQAY